jgi:hypothetical protein
MVSAYWYVGMWASLAFPFFSCRLCFMVLMSLSEKLSYHFMSVRLVQQSQLCAEFHLCIVLWFCLFP